MKIIRGNMFKPHKCGVLLCLFEAMNGVVESYMKCKCPQNPPSLSPTLSHSIIKFATTNSPHTRYAHP